MIRNDNDDDDATRWQRSYLKLRKGHSKEVQSVSKHDSVITRADRTSPGLPTWIYQFRNMDLRAKNADVSEPLMISKRLVVYIHTHIQTCLSKGRHPTRFHSHFRTSSTRCVKRETLASLAGTVVAPTKSCLLFHLYPTIIPSDCPLRMYPQHSQK